MGRPPRVEQAGAYHHIMNRGGGRREIFVDDRDRRRFMKLIAEAHQNFGLEVHAFCLMGNHFHILTRTPLANVGEAMHHITSCYASWFNDRRNSDGSLFRGRYLAKHVAADDYLLHVSRYIHLNPVKAKMTASARAYAWSSMPAYLGLVPRPPWLFIGQILTMIGGSSPRADYDDFVAGGECVENPRWYRESHNEQPQKISASDDAHGILAVVDQLVATEFDVEVATLLRGGRGQRNVARMIAAAISREMTELGLLPLAAHYGFKNTGGVQASIARLRASSLGDPALAATITKITGDVEKVVVPGTN